MHRTLSRDSEPVSHRRPRAPNARSTCRNPTHNTTDHYYYHHSLCSSTRAPPVSPLPSSRCVVRDDRSRLPSSSIRATRGASVVALCRSVVVYSCARLQSHTRTLLSDDDDVDRFVDRVDVCASSNSFVVVVSSMGDPATRCVVVVVVVSKAHSWWWFG